MVLINICSRLYDTEESVLNLAKKVLFEILFCNSRTGHDYSKYVSAITDILINVSCVNTSLIQGIFLESCILDKNEPTAWKQQLEDISSLLTAKISNGNIKNSEIGAALDLSLVLAKVIPNSFSEQLSDYYLLLRKSSGENSQLLNHEHLTIILILREILKTSQNPDLKIVKSIEANMTSLLSKGANLVPFFNRFGLVSPAFAKLQYTLRRTSIKLLKSF